MCKRIGLSISPPWIALSQPIPTRKAPSTWKRGLASDPFEAVWDLWKAPVRVTSSAIGETPWLPCDFSVTAEDSSPAGRNGCWMSEPSLQRPASLWWSDGGCLDGLARGRCTWHTRPGPWARSSDTGQSGAETPYRNLEAPCHKHWFCHKALRQ